MLNTILTPLDGSPAAEAGLAWAKQAAMKSGARLDLLTVVDNTRQEPNGHLEEAQRYLFAQRDLVAAEGLAVEAEVALGAPGEQILARAANATLTVMAYPTNVWLFGGALDLVMRETASPLVVIRHRTGQQVPEFDTRKILVPIDQSEYSRLALPIAVEMCRAMGASIILLSIVIPASHIPHLRTAQPELRDAVYLQAQEAQALLDQAAESIGREGVPIETAVAIGDPVREIIRAARELDAGLIAMATKGSNSLSKVLGSTALGVAQASPIPCLLVRPEPFL
jgi:nucleotide-binding universal stress UspA family protein